MHLGAEQSVNVTYGQKMQWKERCYFHTKLKTAMLRKVSSNTR